MQYVFKKTFKYVSKAEPAKKGVPEAEGSIFSYKSLQTPHFARKKKILGSFLGIFSLPPLYNFSPKYIQTPQNTFHSSLFTTIAR